MEKEIVSKKVKVVRCFENKSPEQVKKGFLYKVKVRTDSVDRDGDPEVKNKLVKSKVKLDKAGEYEVLVEMGSFEDRDTKKEIFYEGILEIRK